jgi:hypothetical protein
MEIHQIYQDIYELKNLGDEGGAHFYFWTGKATKGREATLIKNYHKPFYNPHL